MQTNKMTLGQGFYKQQGHWQPLCKVCAPPWSYVLGIKGEEEGGRGVVERSEIGGLITINTCDRWWKVKFQLGLKPRAFNLVICSRETLYSFPNCSLIIGKCNIQQQAIHETMYILYNGLFLVVEYNLEFLQYLHQLTSSGWLSVREGEVMDGETGTSHLMK